MTSETMFTQSSSIGFKWEIRLRYLKMTVKVMSDAKEYIL